MNTELKYMEDTYKFSDIANLVKIDADDRGQYCVLDSTIFYPQGGGQPTDLGDVTIDNNIYKISFVSFVNGEVRLYGSFSELENNNQKVSQTVNSEERLRNAKSHTAGHLLTMIIEKETDMIGVKGYHFPNGSYIEFEGQKPENVEEFLEKINQKVEETILDKRGIVVEMVSLDELASRCKNVPSYLPANKPVRIMTIDGFEPMPCGGTHLSSLEDLKYSKATKMKSKKGRVKVSYEFA